LTVLIEDPPTGVERVGGAARGPGASLTKRCLDIAIALALLLFFAPLLAAVAAAVRTSSAGPVLFRQRRTGLDGRPFQILKFRSMTVMEDGAVVAASKDDQRVTRVGAMLRRTSLDELPQLWNVVKGDMSLVGPRPHALSHDELFGALDPDYRRRFGTRPGMTGLAQITGFRGEVRGREDLAGRIEADLRYIQTWSPALDLKILVATARLMWSDEKAY
jgi:putative colanic acid biosynthesis UDP-glucose lipid carrier transferase